VEEPSRRLIPLFRRKIKDNSYEWPAGIDLSAEAVDLVSAILTTQPEHRPSLTDVLAHDWFISGPFPPSISTSSLTAPPDYRQMSIRASHRNFAAVKKQCGVTEAPTMTLLPVVEKAALAAVAEEAEQATIAGMSRMALDGPAVVTEVRGMEKEVRDVLQPGSPISDLLRSVPSSVPLQLLLTGWCTDRLESRSWSPPMPNLENSCSESSSPKLVQEPVDPSSPPIRPQTLRYLSGGVSHRQCHRRRRRMVDRAPRRMWGHRRRRTTGSIDV
jgi:serine/threonine protein kinase